MRSTMQDVPLSIAALLRRGSEVHANAEVITWSGDTARRASYAQLGLRAAQLANALGTLGVRADDRVATFMWNNSEHLEAYLAVPSMGAVLHTLNIRLFPEQIIFIANHAQDRVVIVDHSLVNTLAPLLKHMKSVRHVVIVGGTASDLDAPHEISVHSYSDLLAAQSTRFNWVEADERSAAAMCYTSGTTGDPKGVVYSHRSIWLHSMQMCMTDSFALSELDRALAVVPMFHAMSWGLPYAAFMVGASLVMPDRFLQPAALLQLLAAERPTKAAAVPTIWQGLLQQLEAHPQDISHLREVLVGGSACPDWMIRVFSDKYGVEILHAWGMTETSPLCTVARPPAGATGEHAWRYRYTQGRFPASVRARLVADDGSELPWDDKSVGGLEVGGPWVTATYYAPEDSPISDADKFHDGWLRTGDVGHISPDGFLSLTDRTKDVIKSGGEWISSVELENIVMGHPAIAEAAVVGIPDSKWGERPLVAVVLRAGHDADAEQLRDYIAASIPRWQVPENWSFISQIPKTSTGKFDKKRLRADHSVGALQVLRVDQSDHRT